MKRNISTLDLDDIRRMRPEVLGAVIHWLEAHDNSTTPQLRAGLSELFPAVLAMYSLLLVAAVSTNCCLVLYAYRHRLYLLLNLGLGNLLLGCQLLPATVVVLLYQDWVLGRTACHLLPLIQDMFSHVIVLGHLALVVDKYREVQGQARYSPRRVALTTWATALCLVLPCKPYIFYIDLEVLGPQYRELGICCASLKGRIKDYIRFVVVLVYLLPVLIMACLYIRMRRALLISLRHLDLMVEPRGSLDSKSSPTIRRNNMRRSHLGTLGTQRMEVRECYANMRSLCAASAVCAACLSPLMLLRLTSIRTVEETSSRAGGGRFDLFHCIVVWFTFLPCVMSPLILLHSEFTRSQTGSWREFLRPRRCSDCQSHKTVSRLRRHTDTTGWNLRPQCDPGSGQGISYL